MSALPSFMFSAFPSKSDQRFVGWATFRDSLAAGRRIADDAAEIAPLRTGHVEFTRVGIWRLLASNNRELGRSWAAYPSFDSAHADVERLQRSAAQLSISVVKGASSSQYGWLATLEGEPVITSGRWFGASSTALHSAVTTLEAFSSAVVSSSVWPGGRAAERKHTLARDPGPSW